MDFSIQFMANGTLAIYENNIRYIHAPEYMCPTHDYGVTFERATAVKLGQTDFLREPAPA